MSKEPHPIDITIGKNLRSKRLLGGLNQDQLGELFDPPIGNTQVTKYENGVDRLSARALVQLAIGLKCPVQAFFDGVAEFLPTKEDQALTVNLKESKLLTAYRKIEDEEVRQRVTEMVSAILLSLNSKKPKRR